MGSYPKVLLVNDFKPHNINPVIPAPEPLIFSPRNAPSKAIPTKPVRNQTTPGDSDRNPLSCALCQSLNTYRVGGLNDEWPETESLFSAKHILCFYKKSPEQNHFARDLVVCQTWVTV